MNLKTDVDNNTFTLTAKLLYDPYRKDFRKTDKTRTLIAQLPRDDLTALYRWFIKRRFYAPWDDMQAPMFGNHVTIVGGREKFSSDAWRKHEGRKVELVLRPEIYKTWKFWVMPVVNTDLIDGLRAELGLGKLKHPHLTVGRDYD